MDLFPFAGGTQQVKKDLDALHPHTTEELKVIKQTILSIHLL